ncbi:cysteine desulfurase [Candidatus Berkelbacteria bacterium]|nr:cysteine desulfurase [Candidatus Berkelbacteria bacterium]
MNYSSRVYADFAAAAPMWPRVQHAWQGACKNFGNPSSLHQFGRESKELLNLARQKIARLLECHPHELIFTSGATESTNLALLGIIRAQLRKPHVITLAIEHPAVLAPLQHEAKAKRITLTILPVTTHGQVKLATLKSALKPTTRLVSIMAANNEIGTLQPIRQVAGVLKTYQKQTGQKIWLHTDASQFAAWHQFTVDQLGIDLLTLSGPKIGAGSGIGLLYHKHETPLEPLFYGGGQQTGLRSGTENVMGAIRIQIALQETWQRLPKIKKKIRIYRDKIADELVNFFPNSIRNDQPEGLPNLLSLTFPSLDAEQIVYLLDQAGIAVSTGSACSQTDPKHAGMNLRTIGREYDDIYSTIRISLGWTTTQRDTQKIIHAFKIALQVSQAQSGLTRRVTRTGKIIARNYAFSAQ